MSEFAPAGSQARMTKSQIKKYIRNMEEAQKAAKEKLKQAEASGELQKEQQELEELENKLEEL